MADSKYGHLNGNGSNGTKAQLPALTTTTQQQQALEIFCQVAIQKLEGLEGELTNTAKKEYRKQQNLANHYRKNPNAIKLAAFSSIFFTCAFLSSFFIARNTSDYATETGAEITAMLTAFAGSISLLLTCVLATPRNCLDQLSAGATLWCAPSYADVTATLSEGQIQKLLSTLTALKQLAKLTDINISNAATNTPFQAGKDYHQTNTTAVTDGLLNTIDEEETKTANQDNKTENSTSNELEKTVTINVHYPIPTEKKPLGFFHAMTNDMKKQFNFIQSQLKLLTTEHNHPQSAAKIVGTAYGQIKYSLEHDRNTLIKYSDVKEKFAEIADCKEKQPNYGACSS